MITHGNEIKLFSGNSNRPLAEAIAKSSKPSLAALKLQPSPTVKSTFISKKLFAAGICLLFNPPALPSTTI